MFWQSEYEVEDLPPPYIPIRNLLKHNILTISKHFIL